MFKGYYTDSRPNHSIAAGISTVMLAKNFFPFSLIIRWSDRRALSKKTTAEPLPETGTLADLLGFNTSPKAPTPREPPQSVTKKALALPTAVLRAWAMHQLSHWRFNPVSRSYSEETFMALNEEDPNTFIYAFACGEVRLLEKPQTSGASQTNRARAKKYLSFFSDVASMLPAEFITTIAMGVSDKVVFVPEIPVFSFQKRIGSNTVLAPDIDFLDFDFYESEHVTDTTDFRDKIDGAIFIGGTTGGEITMEVAQTCSLPRLRAARFFQDNPRIDFQLPQIVQAVDAETEAWLRRLPFCQGGRVSWKQQLKRRCLISIDGNGATCSRVVIALRSNSVLLKYVSDETLYYFPGLVPWVHYIPILEDADVEKCIDLDNWSTDSLQHIASESRRFAEEFLTRPAVTAYMAELLQLYNSCFIGALAPPVPPPLTILHPFDEQKIFLIAHIEEVGDSESGADGWVGSISGARRIEGFSIATNDVQWPSRIQYQTLKGDNTLSNPALGGEFCGTRGKQLPIYGFVIHAEKEFSVSNDLSYEAVFGDGHRSGLRPAGFVCSSPTKAPLIAMRVLIKRTS